MNQLKEILLDRYETIQRASEELGVTRQLLYKWIRNGVCLNKCAKVGKKLKVHPAKLNYPKIKEIVPELEDYDDLVDPD
jgi:transposase-like protein